MLQENEIQVFFQIWCENFENLYLGPTSQRNTGDWSYTGGYGQAQPDNREAAQGMKKKIK